mmetsp:Transcript_32270/g.74302  ORF Transcript_32270/g.74302 Transcript_32270/m.74302 type:complete len:230 (-) Transcript_32270:1047-1736(-)
MILCIGISRSIGIWGRIVHGRLVLTHGTGGGAGLRRRSVGIGSRAVSRRVVSVVTRLLIVSVSSVGRHPVHVGLRRVGRRGLSVPDLIWVHGLVVVGRLSHVGIVHGHGIGHVHVRRLSLVGFGRSLLIGVGIGGILCRSSHRIGMRIAHHMSLRMVKRRIGMRIRREGRRGMLRHAHSISHVGVETGFVPGSRIGSLAEGSVGIDLGRPYGLVERLYVRLGGSHGIAG